MSKWLKQLRSMFLGDDGCGENASVPPSGRSADFLRVTVRQGVINEIFDQVEKHERKRRGCETGGGLIGKLCHSKRSGWLMQVQGLLAPGPCAEYRPGYFGADRAFQQRCLRTHQERDRELSFLGDWHRHPLQMRYPSPGDHSTDRDNLAEAFNEEKQGIFLFPIVSRHLIGSIHRLAPSITSGDGFWKIDFHYLTHARRSHYQLIYPQIEAGPSLELNCLDEGPVISALKAFYPDMRLSCNRRQGWAEMEIMRPVWGGYSVFFLLPPGYPFDPPQVWISGNGRTRSYESRMLDPWSDALNLLNLIYEIDHMEGGIYHGLVQPKRVREDAIGAGMPGDEGNRLPPRAEETRGAALLDGPSQPHPFDIQPGDPVSGQFSGERAPGLCDQSGSASGDAPSSVRPADVHLPSGLCPKKRSL
jgi:hypothetical protein